MLTGSESYTPSSTSMTTTRPRIGSETGVSGTDVSALEGQIIGIDYATDQSLTTILSFTPDYPGTGPRRSMTWPH